MGKKRRKLVQEPKKEFQMSKETVGEERSAKAKLEAITSI